MSFNRNTFTTICLFLFVLLLLFVYLLFYYFVFNKHVLHVLFCLVICKMKTKQVF